MPETAPRELRVSRKEARQKIEAQIEKGQQLRDQQIYSDDELYKARMEKATIGQHTTEIS